MRIVSTSPRLEPSSSALQVPLLDGLIKNHPAGLLFNISIVEYSLDELVLALDLRDELSAQPCSIKGALGCIVDCAARLYGQGLIGPCDLAEYEVTIHGEASGNTLILYVRMDSSSTQHAVYHCAIYSTGHRKTALIAESQGTLVRRVAG